MKINVESIIARATSDADFLGRLRRDPIAALKAEGYDASPEEVRTTLGISADASDKELAEALNARLTHC